MIPTTFFFCSKLKLCFPTEKREAQHPLLAWYRTGRLPSTPCKNAVAQCGQTAAAVAPRRANYHVTRIIYVLFLCFEVENTHGVAFKTATASRQPNLIGSFEVEKAKTIAAGGRVERVGRGGVPARREKAARGSNGNVTRLKFLKLGLQMQPNIHARPP